MPVPRKSTIYPKVVRHLLQDHLEVDVVDQLERGARSDEYMRGFHDGLHGAPGDTDDHVLDGTE